MLVKLRHLIPLDLVKEIIILIISSSVKEIIISQKLKNISTK